MDNKKSIVLIILILIILILGYVLIKNNDMKFNKFIDNSSNNNTHSKTMYSNSINNSTYTTNNTNNKYDNNLSKQNSNYINKNNYQHSKKSKTKPDELTADDVLKIVRKGVWWEDSHGKSTRDVRLSKPFKNGNWDWLVGAFDKKTGKFLGSVWVAFNGGGFSHGPDSYSEYKDIISGKNSYKSDTNKYNYDESKSNQVEEEIPDFSNSYVLAKTNPDITSNLSDNFFNLNSDNTLNLNQQIPNDGFEVINVTT